MSEHTEDERAALEEMKNQVEANKKNKTSPLSEYQVAKEEGDPRKQAEAAAKVLGGSPKRGSLHDMISHKQEARRDDGTYKLPHYSEKGDED